MCFRAVPTMCKIGFLVNLILILVLCCAAFTASAAETTPAQVVDKVDSTLLELALKEIKVKYEESGVNSYICDVDDTKVSLRSTGDEITIIADFPGRKVTRNRMNDWNTRKRLSCAYLDRSGALKLRMTLSAKGGVTGETIGYFIGRSIPIVRAFKAHLE